MSTSRRRYVQIPGNSVSVSLRQKVPKIWEFWGEFWRIETFYLSKFSPATGVTFPPTSWLLLPWQASPPVKVRGDAANPLISRPGRLRTSEIPIPLLVSSAVTHHCHHRPALLFRDWHPFTKPVMILTKEISSTFVLRSQGLILKGWPIE